MSALARFRIEPPPVHHVPTFSVDEIPLGWQRCALCGALIDRYRWASTTCPGQSAR